MWDYSTTAATSAQATSASTTESFSSFKSTYSWTAGHSFSHNESVSTSSARSVGPYETSQVNQSGLSIHESLNAVGTATTTASSREQRWSGFTRSTTGYTTEQNGGVTTSSNEQTTTRGRASYSSGTQTETTTAAKQTTTTQATTRSAHTSTTGQATTSTTQAITVTTSTTQAATITRTTYATIASTTITAPVSLVPVTEMEATEQGWEVTKTADSAGYASHLGATFTKRTGTWNTASTALPVTNTMTITRSVTETGGTTIGTTLTTSNTSTAVDTYRVADGVYPATTATRPFTVLSTSTTAMTFANSRTFTTTLTGWTSNLNNFAETFLTTRVSSAPLTYNVSPTQTSTASLHLTWRETTMITLERFVSSFAESQSTTTSQTFTGVLTETVPFTDSESQTYTESGFFESYTFTDNNVGENGVFTDSESFVDAGTTFSYYSTYTVDSPSRTYSVEGYYSSSSTYTVSWETTISTTALSFMTSGSLLSRVQGITYTHPQLIPQNTFAGTSPWTVHAMHPRQGFRGVIRLESTEGLYSNLSATPSIYYPYRATQDDVSGAVAPKIWTDTVSYSSGATRYTAQWMTSDSRLHVTSQTNGATTSSAYTVLFSRDGAVSWHAPQSTARTSGTASDLDLGASKIGGIVPKSEYGVAGFFRPGVRNWTSQAAGTSTSGTSWLAAPHTFVDSTAGFAMPTRTESVYSLTQQETSWSWNAALQAPVSTGATVRPMVSLSLNPDL